MNAYQTVQNAREVSRITALEVVDTLCLEYIELFGDRKMKDEQALVGGVGLMDQHPLTFIGIQKGHTTEENIQRNFGASGPAGYRKAERLMKQAEKFHRPVLTLINTSGAYAAPESEEYGIGEAIASCLLTMSKLTVPTLAIILGEGGSGGAIALALTDEVWMLENSIYSILSPEAFASILWKDRKLAPQAAEEMKLTADELLELNVIERIISESNKYGALSNEEILRSLTQQIKEKMYQLMNVDKHERFKKRQARFRNF